MKGLLPLDLKLREIIALIKGVEIGPQRFSTGGEMSPLQGLFSL